MRFVGIARDGEEEEECWYARRLLSERQGESTLRRLPVDYLQCAPARLLVLWISSFMNISMSQVRQPCFVFVVRLR